MIIKGIKIKKIDACSLMCEALILSNKWKIINYIRYYCTTGEWQGMKYHISTNIKKKCRKVWYHAAEVAGINRNDLNIKI